MPLTSPVTADAILAAIQSNGLRAFGITHLGRVPQIIFRIHSDEFATIKCLQGSQPIVSVVPDPPTVHVGASEGISDGFRIQCQNHEEAVLICSHLEACMQSEYAKLFREA